MRKAFIFLIAILILIFVPLSLSALELKQGRLKLILHEKTGRFSLYYLEDVRTNRYSPLFLDQDPRTTYLSILVNNKVYRMGETSGFTEKLEKTNSGARFIWESSFLRVTQAFSFISSANSPLSNGISIDIGVTNISEQNLSVGVRYLVDTNLGEKGNSHFETDTLSQITNEREFIKPRIPKYILSRSANAANPGLQIMTAAPGVTKPDRIVLSNWKRLNDNSWTYDVNTTRNFNQLPYSINDSAVALFYNPVPVKKGDKLLVSFPVGAFTNEGFALQGESSRGEIEQLFDKTVTQSSSMPQDIELAVQTDLIAVRDLIARINSKIENGEEITKAEIGVLYQVIQELKARKLRYESR